MTSPALQKDIDRFLRAAKNAGAAQDEHQKRATRGFLINRALNLRAQRDDLRLKMDAGWDWLQQHPDDPAFARNEDLWLGWKTDYETICDALSEGVDLWLHLPHTPKAQVA
jgi:hypothetical protein